MSYPVPYTNSTKDPIIVADGTINHDTSLNLIGKNASGYGQSVAENFLHLLENFANVTPPLAPVEGQLWYDTGLPTNKILKVYDGANWFPANGVHQTSDEPQFKKTGDIWVATSTSQVKIWNGTTWILIGPTTTSGSKNGIYVEQILDNLGQNAVYHTVVISYVNDNAITIVSQDQFTPNPSILGFSTLYPGLNVSTRTFGTVQAKLIGLSNSALNLQVSETVEPIPADNFLRNDVAGQSSRTIQGFINISSNAGIRIGAVTQTVLLERQGNDAVLSNRTSGAKIHLSIVKSGLLKQIVTVDGNTQRVGINNNAPTKTLDVNGDARIVGKTSITSTDIEALSVAGGTKISGQLTVTNVVFFGNDLTVVGKTTVGQLGSNGIGLEPISSHNWDIGSANKPFRTVYADNFSTTATSFSMIATGMILPFAGTAVPDGWLVCDGSLALKSSYKNLYDTIGDQFGPGSATEFVLPAITVIVTANVVPANINYFIKF